MKASQSPKSYGLNDPLTGAFFHFTEDLNADQKLAFSMPLANHILWNRSHQKYTFFCDDQTVVIQPNSFCTLTALNFVKLPKDNNKLTAISFNQEFYCIRDHDHEVSCNGILFYGAQNFPLLPIPSEDQPGLEKLCDLFIQEFKEVDPVHNEMLVTLLKLLIIRLTRIGKSKIRRVQGDHQNIEIIRKFNFLVELNFRKKKQISDYAFLLNVSPKKLSEIFRNAKLDPPLVTIHKRIILEAKRMLLFSLKSINEISDELGFEDASQLSKLFKKITNKTPSHFKMMKD